MRVRRSLLFVPGGEPSALEAARRSAADGLILDLEDTVPPARKAHARRLVGGFLAQPLRRGLERAVRINAATTPWFRDDLQVVVKAGADALVLPKVESAEDIHRVVRQLKGAERQARRAPGSVKLLALIETPRGVLHSHPIATASPHIEALAMGHVDLSRTLGIKEAGAMQGSILHARCQLVLAAKAAGRDAIDTVFMNLDDPDGFTAEARQGRALGFGGKLLVDESQVAQLHEVYRPSEAEIAYARRLIAAFEAAVAEGKGIFLFEGRVIDLPVVEAERTVLERAKTPARSGAGGPPRGTSGG
jgi:citrate lyase subunit beta/citryl-CoA lyase